MPKYLIEREIPGGSKLTRRAARHLANVLRRAARDGTAQIQWVQSYVAGDKIYCVYIAPDEASVREHATRGGFPANRISQITSIIDPTTAEG
jgi:hypothetical protein